jgi:prepilin signal peptidase PulO-like enzyme (type II secretory pathway)
MEQIPMLLIGSILFVFGAVIGSFLNVLIDRYDSLASVLSDRSRCDHCKRVLRWYELIPILSYVIQGGRCKRCKKSLSLQYPLVETVTGCVFVLIGLQFLPYPLLLIGWLLIASSLIVIVVADLKYYIIPDVALIIAILGAFLLMLPMPEIILLRLASGIGALLFMYAIYSLTKGKGMGFGDVKFAFFLGFALGFPQIVVSLYLAFLTGALIGVILILVWKKTHKSKVPFGPFLVWGYVVAVLYYPAIREWLGFF